MESIINNEPSTSDSSDQPIYISSDTEIESEPEPQPITGPKEIDDLVLHFESKANEHLHYVVHDCTNYVNPAQSDVVWADFRRWMNSHSWELKGLYYTASQRRFHDKLFDVLEPLVELFSPKSPIRALPPLESLVP